MAQKTEDSAYYQSLASEQNVIGSLLIDNESLNRIYGKLKPVMFHNQVLAHAFDICLKAYDENKPYDVIFLSQELCSRLNMSDQAVFDSLRECTANTISTANIETHADVIIEKYANRLARKASQGIIATPDKAKEILHTVVDELDEIDIDGNKTYRTLSDVAKTHKDKYFNEGSQNRQMPIGIKALDEVMYLRGGDMVVIGARPAVGKSALATQIVNFLSEKYKVGYFNLEMSEEQVFERFVANESGIGLTRITRALRFMNDEEEKYNAAVAKLEENENLVIASGTRSVNEIRAITKREQFDVVVVDYLQLVLSGGYFRDRREETGYISHKIKAIAMEFDIPVIALSQMNRLSEGKLNKKPTMSELRESGDVEQDASIVLLLWNKDEEDRSKKGWVADKVRQGDAGREGELIFDGDKMKFYSEDDDGFVDADMDMIPF